MFRGHIAEALRGCAHDRGRGGERREGGRISSAGGGARGFNRSTGLWVELRSRSGCSSLYLVLHRRLLSPYLKKHQVMLSINN